MPGRDEQPIASRIAVLECRRLVRQMYSIWLAKQSDLVFVGAAGSVSTLIQLCDQSEVDIVVVGMPCRRTDEHATSDELGRFAAEHPGVQLLATGELDTLVDGSDVTMLPGSYGIHRLREILQSSDLHTGTEEGAATLEEPTSLGPLTPREAEVLSLVGQGSTTHDISAQLGISRSTVANHKERIFSKLHANNQAHAVARAVNLGLISPIREEDPRQVG